MRIISRAVSVVKYLLAVSIILGGISTAFGPVRPEDGALGFLYSSRLTLAVFGVIFISCGVVLLIAKIRKNVRWTGRSLMAIHCSYLFGAIIQATANGPDPSTWLVNFILAIIAGALWIYWKIKTEYIDNKLFKEIAELHAEIRNEENSP